VASVVEAVVVVNCRHGVVPHALSSFKYDVQQISVEVQLKLLLQIKLRALFVQKE